MTTKPTTFLAAEVDCLVADCDTSVGVGSAATNWQCVPDIELDWVIYLRLASFGDCEKQVNNIPLLQPILSFDAYALGSMDATINSQSFASYTTGAC